MQQHNAVGQTNTSPFPPSPFEQHQPRTPMTNVTESHMFYAQNIE